MKKARPKIKLEVVQMKRRHVAALSLLLAFTVVIGFVGCGREGSILEPTRDELTPLPLPASTLSGQGCPGMNEVSKVISAEMGGEVTLEFCTVVIPPGALDVDTEISIKLDDPAYAIVDLGPDGTQFNVPVQIKYDLDLFFGYLKENGLEPTDLVVALYDEETGTWAPLESYVEYEFVEDGGGYPGGMGGWDEDEDWGERDEDFEYKTFLVGETEHFSRYALAD